jgi:hypothetical protein
MSEGYSWRDLTGFLVSVHRDQAARQEAGDRQVAALRASVWQLQRQAGVMTLNEVRARQDRASLPPGTIVLRARSLSLQEMLGT